MEILMNAQSARHWMAATSAAVLASLFFMTSPMPSAHASAPTKSGEQAERHFKVPEPATKDDAVTLLQNSLQKIVTSLEQSNFEAIHEASYGVEAALARIGKEPGFDGVTAYVAPRCEIVHLASEMQDAETLKVAVPILVKAVNEQLPTR